MSYLHNHDRLKKTRSFGVPLQWGEKHGCALGNRRQLERYIFLFIRSSNLSISSNFVDLPLCEIWKYIYIYHHYYFIPLHIAIHLDARSSGQCALRCQAGGVWVENRQGGMFPLQTVMFGARMAYFSLNLKSKGSPWSSRSTRMFLFH